jgi:hypothetical protein
VPARRLVVLCALAIGDYLLWNWSLNANHDVLALISGLTLPPLVLALVWLTVVGAMRGLVGFSRRAPQGGRARRPGSRPDVVPRAGEQTLAEARATGDADRSRRKLAA